MLSIPIAHFAFGQELKMAPYFSVESCLFILT